MEQYVPRVVPPDVEEIIRERVREETRIALADGYLMPTLAQREHRAEVARLFYLDGVKEIDELTLRQDMSN